MDDDLPDAIPAATLILMRPAAAAGPPEILMLERAETMAFAAGALVFPGGRIDPEDEAAAERFPRLPDAAARIAAIRETIEETGLAPGLTPTPNAATIAALRQGIADEEPFASLLASGYPGAGWRRWAASGAWYGRMRFASRRFISWYSRFR